MWKHKKGEKVMVVLPATIVSQWGRNENPQYQIMIDGTKVNMDVNEPCISDNVNNSLMLEIRFLKKQCEEWMDKAVKRISDV